jgi:alginate O-acetyltransferase complex protein AlgI
MLFSSIIFIAYFLPLFLAVYYLSGLRTAVLLTGSVAFYVWGEGPYIALLAALIAVNYAVSLWGAGRRDSSWWLIAVVALNLAVLGIFKYADFVAGSLNWLCGTNVLPQLHLALPLGISFFTFQLISYVVDVHRGSIPPERRPLAFATYILMFPHLIAGPIVRYADIREELDREGRHLRVGLGLQYFIVGLCQKVLIANSVAPVADHAFGLGPDLDATMAWLGIVAYTLQIYFDFCGYSNMAIGLAFLLGFTFPKNFDHPYAARSLTDFWRRWHMSLSFWFRDYVYIPLGGNRGGPWRTILNLLVVFFLTGLWHGAAWTFVVWGMFHGMLLLVERLGLRHVLDRTSSVVASGYTLLMVMVGWVLFRADSLHEAGHYLATMANVRAFYEPLADSWVLMGTQFWVALICGLVFAFPIVSLALDAAGRPVFGRSPRIAEARLDTLFVHPLPIPLLLIGFVLSMAILAGNSLNPFLYFRF